MNEEAKPLHHFPSTQGLDQMLQTSPDAWVQFFALCREYAAQVRQQREEKRQGEAVAGEAVQESEPKRQ